MRVFLLLLASLASFAMDKVIFDTDCGYFGDDGSALVMLLRSPDKVDLQGITIVSGNVWAAESETYIGQILAALGRSGVRTYVGAQMPLVHTPSMAKLEGPLAFQGAFARPPRFAEPRSSALDYLAAAIQREPGRITVLALGPMTNIAMLLRLHPDLETKIKRIVFMGGNVHVPGNASKNAEFNFWFDPEAARIVLRSGIPEKVMFPLDICNRAVLTKTLFDQIVAARTPITERYRQDFGLRYPGFLKDSKATGYLWDELAAGWLIDTGFVTKSETAFLDVDTAFGPNYGRTTNLDRKLAPDATPVTVMLDLDFPGYFALYKNLLTR